MAETTMRLRLMTAEGRDLDQEVHFVSLPVVGGAIGVFPKHMRLTAALQEGPVRFSSEKLGEKTVQIIGGFAEVTGDSVLVLTPHAEGECIEQHA